MSRDYPYLHNPFGTAAGAEPWPVAFAHRGFSPAGHENSMAAFRAAVELGYGYVETDVRTTADGELMVFHDESLDRVTDGSGPIAEHTLSQLRRVRIHGVEPIPTMEELLREWPDLKINVDVKDRAGGPLLARLTPCGVLELDSRELSLEEVFLTEFAAPALA